MKKLNYKMNLFDYKNTIICIEFEFYPTSSKAKVVMAEDRVCVGRGEVRKLNY